MRQAVRLIIRSQDDEIPAPSSEGDMRSPVAGRIAATLRLAALPFVALFAAAAGLVFLVLLPVCGIASIAEGMARCCWAFVCGVRRRPRLSRAGGP